MAPLLPLHLGVFPSVPSRVTPFIAPKCPWDGTTWRLQDLRHSGNVASIAAATASNTAAAVVAAAASSVAASASPLAASAAAKHPAQSATACGAANAAQAACAAV